MPIALVKPRMDDPYFSAHAVLSQPVVRGPLGQLICFKLDTPAHRLSVQSIYIISEITEPI
jgi:hypothetical protein